MDLSQYIFLITSSSKKRASNLHGKLKSMKVLSDLSLDRPSFLVIASATDILHLALTEWKRIVRKDKASP